MEIGGQERTAAFFDMVTPKPCHIHMLIAERQPDYRDRNAQPGEGIGQLHSQASVSTTWLTRWQRQKHSAAVAAGTAWEPERDGLVWRATSDEAGRERAGHRTTFGVYRPTWQGVVVRMS